MTQKEAIEVLSRPFHMKSTPQEILDAHRMAIQALKQEDILDKIRNELLSMECMEEAVEVVDKYRLEIPFDGRDEE